MFPSCETQSLTCSGIGFPPPPPPPSLVYRPSWMSGHIKQMFPLGKAENNFFPPILLTWSQTRSCLLITQHPKNVYYKASQGKTTTKSKLAAFQPTYNFRLLIIAHTSNTFSSVTSQAQLVPGCDHSTWRCSSAVVCNWKVFSSRHGDDVIQVCMYRCWLSKKVFKMWT